MRSRIGTKWISLIILLLLPNLALGSPINLPPSKKVDVGTVQVPDVRACFDLEGYKSLMDMAIDLQEALDQNDLKAKVIINLSGEIEDLNSVIKSKDVIIATDQSERDRLTRKWSDTDLALRKEQNKPNWGAIIGYSAAGVFAVSTLVLGIIVYTK